MKTMTRHYWVVGRKGGKGEFPTVVPKLYQTKEVAKWWANFANEDSYTPYSDYIAKKVVLVYGS